MKTIGAVMAVFVIRWIDRRNREQQLVRETEFILKEVLKDE
jgi:hypothetical protein